MTKRRPREYKSVRTLLKAFVENHVSHDEYLRQAPGLPQEPPKPRKKRKRQ